MGDLAGWAQLPAFDLPGRALVVGDLLGRFRPAVTANPQQPWTVAGRWETHTSQTDDSKTTTTLVIEHIAELDGWTLWETRQFHPANLAHIANPEGDLPIGVIAETEHHIDPDTCTV